MKAIFRGKSINQMNMIKKSEQASKLHLEINTLLAKYNRTVSDSLYS